MTYRDFTLEKLEDDFGIINRNERFLENSLPVPPSDFLLKTLARNLKMPIRNEKSRSEWIVAPILAELKELNNDFFTVHSGEYLNVDKTQGLMGECNFIITKNYNSITLKAPVFALVEAKKENFDEGISQCAAQMYAARLFNQKRDPAIAIIHGCVTIGTTWIFLKLEEKDLLIDNYYYTLNDLPQLLGALQAILDFYKNKIWVRYSSTSWISNYSL